MDLRANRKISSKITILELIKYGIYHYLYNECDHIMHAIFIFTISHAYVLVAVFLFLVALTTALFRWYLLNRLIKMFSFICSSMNFYSFFSLHNTHFCCLSLNTSSSDTFIFHTGNLLKLFPWPLVLTVTAFTLKHQQSYPPYSLF